MKKILKKIGALALAGVMVMGLGVTAFGAAGDMKGDGTEDGVIGEYKTADTPTVYDSNVLLYKEITAYNQEALDVNAPTITYEYTIAPGEAGAKVKDAGGESLHASKAAIEVQTKAGLTGATISGSVDKSTYTAGKLEFTPAVQLKTAAAGEKMFSR